MHVYGRAFVTWPFAAERSAAHRTFFLLFCFSFLSYTFLILYNHIGQPQIYVSFRNGCSIELARVAASVVLFVVVCPGKMNFHQTSFLRWEEREGERREKRKMAALVCFLGDFLLPTDRPSSPPLSRSALRPPSSFPTCSFRLLSFAYERLVDVCSERSFDSPWLPP